MHEAAPGEPEKVPGLHRLQLLDPGAAYEPEGQHTRAPVKKERRGSILQIMIDAPIAPLKSANRKRIPVYEAAVLLEQARQADCPSLGL